MDQFIMRGTTVTMKHSTSYHLLYKYSINDSLRTNTGMNHNVTHGKDKQVELVGLLLVTLLDKLYYNTCYGLHLGLPLDQLCQNQSTSYQDVKEPPTLPKKFSV